MQVPSLCFIILPDKLGGKLPKSLSVSNKLCSLVRHSVPMLSLSTYLNIWIAHGWNSPLWVCCRDVVESLRLIFLVNSWLLGWTDDQDLEELIGIQYCNIIYYCNPPGKYRCIQTNSVGLIVRSSYWLALRYKNTHHPRVSWSKWALTTCVQRVRSPLLLWNHGISSLL